MQIRVDAPHAREIRVTVDGAPDARLRPDGGVWRGQVADGAAYGLIVDDGVRTLVDPLATAVGFSPYHDRDAARPGRRPNHEIAPRAVAQPWPARRPS